MKKIIFLFLIFSGFATTSLVEADESAGFCPRLEGARSGACRVRNPKQGCPEGQACTGKRHICTDPSTYIKVDIEQSYCLSFKEVCTPTGPETPPKCEQVCQEWSNTTCHENPKPCFKNCIEGPDEPGYCCAQGCCIPGDSTPEICSADQHCS